MQPTLGRAACIPGVVYSGWGEPQATRGGLQLPGLRLGYLVLKVVGWAAGYRVSHAEGMLPGVACIDDRVKLGWAATSCGLLRIGRAAGDGLVGRVGYGLHLPGRCMHCFLSDRSVLCSSSAERRRAARYEYLVLKVGWAACHGEACLGVGRAAGYRVWRASDRATCYGCRVVSVGLGWLHAAIIGRRMLRVSSRPALEEVCMRVGKVLNSRPSRRCVL
eukprot:scaffold2493_cov62-Phaeocystis_antarctica.AAC.8